MWSRLFWRFSLSRAPKAITGPNVIGHWWGTSGQNSTFYLVHSPLLNICEINRKFSISFLLLVDEHAVYFSVFVAKYIIAVANSFLHRLSLSLPPRGLVTGDSWPSCAPHWHGEFNFLSTELRAGLFDWPLPCSCLLTSFEINWGPDRRGWGGKILMRSSTHI